MGVKIILRIITKRYALDPGKGFPENNFKLIINFTTVWTQVSNLTVWES